MMMYLSEMWKKKTDTRILFILDTSIKRIFKNLKDELY